MSFAHGFFFSGANWDPLNRYIATLSADKTLRIYNPATALTAPLQKITRYNVDETTTESMFIGEDNCMARRRLDFSPDGKLLLSPAGAIRLDPKAEGAKKVPCSFLFDMTSKKKLARATAVLPSTAPTSLGRFCPKLFTLRYYPPPEVASVTPSKSTASEEEEVEPEPVEEAMEVDVRSGSPEIPPPPPPRDNQENQPMYRMVYAVATATTVFFYDTQLERPFAMVDSIHVADISDLAWTSDGRVLIVSSLDGFCTFIEFLEGELGEEYVAPRKRNNVNLEVATSSEVAEFNISNVAPIVQPATSDVIMQSA